jgi:hypothetical protein
MVQIPFNQSIALHDYTKERGYAGAYRFENLVLVETEVNVIYIISVDRARTLTRLPCGRCVFNDESDEQPESFRVEVFPAFLCLKSNRTNFLLQFRRGNFFCSNNNHEDAGTIVFPKDSATHPLVWCIGAGVVGAAMAPALGLGAAALVPVAMSTFGEVVAGVGTIHASLAAGGVAAMLQSSSAALLTTNAAAGGAAIGVALGLISNNVAVDNQREEEEEEEEEEE